MIQRMLAIRFLVPQPFLNLARTSGSSRFTYCWSLAWKIFSITLLALSILNIAVCACDGCIFSQKSLRTRPVMAPQVTRPPCSDGLISSLEAVRQVSGRIKNKHSQSEAHPREQLGPAEKMHPWARLPQAGVCTPGGGSLAGEGRGGFGRQRAGGFQA